MMTVSLREAHSSKLRLSLAAVRSTFLLLLLTTLALCGASSALAQGLQPATNYEFNPTNVGSTASHTINLNGPVGGVSIQSIVVVTEGAPSKDFNLVPSPTQCAGTVDYLVPCTISITFTPSQIGIRLGAIIITNTSSQVVNTIYISGVGVGPQFVFQPATATAVDTGAGVGSFTAGAAIEDGNNNIFFTDVANNRILEESAGPTPVFSIVYTGAPLALTSTTGLAIDGVGNLYVSSGANVYVLAPGASAFTTLATPGVTLKKPTGLAVDVFGDLYISDAQANVVYQVPLDGSAAVALTLPGLPAPPLSGPTGLAVDDNNTLYIADSGNNRIVERPLATGSPVATVLTLSIALNNPTGVAVDPAGTVYIADTGNHQIVEATVPGDQFVLATVPAFTLDNPASILINEANGDLVVSDTTLGLVTFDRTTAAANYPTPTEVGTLDTTDDPRTITIQGTGNIASSLTTGFSGANPTAFPIAPTGRTCTVPTGVNFVIGDVCTYDLNFQPTVVGPNTANFVFTGGAAPLTATLTGTGYTTLKYFGLVAISNPVTTPTTINLHDTVKLVLTAYKSDGTIATDYVGTITFTTTDSTALYFGGTPASANTVTYNFTAADNGVLTIPDNPPTSGLQLNQYGIWTATSTANAASLPPNPPGANPVATSNPIHVIEPATFALTSSINPTAVNQSTTFTLTITATGPSPITPAGTVTFYSNGVQIGSPVNVTGSGAVGTASLPDSFATPGSYAITATYTPTSFTQGGTASLPTQVVGNASSVTLTSSINPSLVGQSTNLTAIITSSATFGAATGTVQFFDGATSLGTAAVSGAAATLPVSFATAGNHSLTAVYTSTNPNLTGSTSGPYIQHVLNVATLALTSSVNPSNPGQSTTLTATLTALGTPGGSIKFYDGATLIGTVTLPTNSISVSFTTPGNHILTAVYSGDANTETITSPPLTQVVLYATTATLTSSVNPVDVNANTTLTATVHSSTGTPTGTVTFKSNGTVIGTGTLNGGVATLVTSFKLPGTYTLIAVYGGDSNNQGATTNTVLETVLNVVNIALTSSVNPVFLDNNTVLTATLTTAAAGTTPTGAVNFFDGATPIGSGTIVNGQVSITASFVYAGPHSITAVFAGDAQDAPATSPPFTQTVADFSLTVASGGSSSASTIAGGTANYALVVTPLITSTFPGPITLTFSGLPATITGTITPTTIAAGSGATPVTFSATAETLLQLGHLQRPPTRHSPMRYAPITLALLALPLAWFRRRKRFASLFASILLLFAITAGLSGCAGPADTGYYGETPKSYNLTVTATSGNLSRSVYLALTVQ
jgi:sugar lactone lactonase YvrE